MKRQFITEVSRIHELMGVISEQSIEDIKSGNAILKVGSRGDSVEQVQNALGIDADGIFGPNTKKAVENFQDENGLKVDGIVGKNTIAKMNISGGGLENTGSDSAEAKSAGYRIGELFGEGVKNFVITVGKVTFYVVVGTGYVIFCIGEAIYKTTVELGKMVLNWLKQLGIATVKAVTEFAKSVTEVIKNGLVKLGIAIKKGYEFVVDGLKKLKDGIIKILSNILSYIKELGVKILAQALMLAAKVFAGVQAIIAWLGKQWSMVEEFAKTAWDEVVSGVQQGVDWVKNKASEAYGQAKDFFKGFMSVFENYLRTENLIMEMSIYSILSEMEHNPNKNILLN